MSGFLGPTTHGSAFKKGSYLGPTTHGDGVCHPRAPPLLRDPPPSMGIDRKLSATNADPEAWKSHLES